MMSYADRLTTRTKIESNDTLLHKLVIKRGGYLPPNNDWRRDGKDIGRNTNIKELSFGYDLPLCCVPRNEFEEFSVGIASNRSIERLKISCSDAFGGDIFTMLTSFFERNDNLHYLRVAWSGFHDQRSVLVLESLCLLREALSKFDTLREFVCPREILLQSDDLGMLVQALARHSALETIDLSGNNIGIGAMGALSALLTKPQSSLTEIVLKDCDIWDESAYVLADALAGNFSLRSLNLGSNGSITTDGWMAIFKELPQSSLENIDLWGNEIEDNSASLLANSLTSASQLKALNLARNDNIGTAGWLLLFDALQRPHCNLQELRLHSNGISLTDEEIIHLANCLMTNHVLRYLSLGDNHEISLAGWEALSGVFQSHCSGLEIVKLQSTSIDNLALVFFANSLRGNSKLRELILDVNECTHWGSLSTVLCNKASIDATFNSNHTLKKISERKSIELQLPFYLRLLLRWNAESTPMEAARRKIINAHFSGDFSLQPFIDINFNVLPFAIAWMAKDEHGSSLTFQFLRNTSFFCDAVG